MNLNDILAKKAEDLSTEEKAFLVEHKSELTDEQKATFGVDGDVPAEPETPAAEPETPAEPTPAEEPKEAKEPKGKQITMSEAEVDALRTAAEQGAKALQKIEASERKAMIEKFTLSENNRAGHFLPKQAGALESFLKTLSEPQRDAFKQLVGNMPKADATIFSEIGDGGADNATDANAVAKEVQKEAMKIASERKIAYGTAVRALFAEQPELKKRYDEALAQNA